MLTAVTWKITLEGFIAMRDVPLRWSLRLSGAIALSRLWWLGLLWLWMVPQQLHSGDILAEEMTSVDVCLRRLLNLKVYVRK